MPIYRISAKIDQIVTKEVRLMVEAPTQEEAHERAAEALQIYPEAVAVQGLLRIVTEKSHYWIPKSIAFTKTEEVKKV